jgi:hypothetical protein
VLWCWLLCFASGFCGLLLASVLSCWLLFFAVGFCALLLTSVLSCWLLCSAIGFCARLLASVLSCWLLCSAFGFCAIVLASVLCCWLHGYRTIPITVRIAPQDYCTVFATVRLRILLLATTDLQKATATLLLRWLYCIVQYSGVLKLSSEPCTDELISRSYYVGRFTPAAVD